ncbi:maleylpyruvate isomerase family mycothiol-dependent enzyme [Amycolatopsis xylanica]|nr:maleylpyruvate isomerase family mycothiol-dependent enzyme [Amycolatopsis xylanica]
MSGQAMIDPGRLLDVLAAEGEVLADTAHDASAEAPVPTAPGWTIGATLRHVGSVYRFVLAWLLAGSRPSEWQRDPEPGQAVEEYFEESRRELLDHLGAHDPAEPASTWWPADRTYGFWRRRMAHETIIHRFDVQNAAGVAITEIPKDVAVDGIDEVLTVWFGQKLPLLGLTGTKAGQAGIRSGGHSWIARAGPDETTAWRCSPEEADRSDALVSGSAAQVYLWLWGRASPTAVTYGGDLDISGQLWALLRLATR